MQRENKGLEDTVKGAKALRETIFSLNFALKDASRRHVIDLAILKENTLIQLEAKQKLEQTHKSAVQIREISIQKHIESLENVAMRRSELEEKLLVAENKRKKAENRAKIAGKVVENVKKEREKWVELEGKVRSAVGLVKDIADYVKEFTNRESFTVNFS